jgi:hypothetical protein
VELLSSLEEFCQLRHEELVQGQCDMSGGKMYLEAFSEVRGYCTGVL